MIRLKQGESRFIQVRGRTDKGGLAPIGERGPVSCTSSDPKVLKVEDLGSHRFKVTCTGVGPVKVTNLFTPNGKSEPHREVLLFEGIAEGDTLTGVGSEVTVE